MDQAYEFLKHSTGIQYQVITALLREFERDVSQMKGTVMDVGCGPGNNTKNLILPKISKDAVMVGLDISEKMVECARKLNADEKERLSFEQLDIEIKDLPAEYKERFDHGFSFFCFQWIQDLRSCFGNIYKLLKPGGTFISQHILLFNVYNGYLTLAERDKFKEYIKDVKKFITPLYFVEDPRETFVKILEDIGFQVLHCSIREKVSGYKCLADRKELFASVNPFVPLMPEDVKNEYMDALIEETLKEETVMFRKSDDSSNEEKVFDLYKLIMLHIKKPENKFSLRQVVEFICNRNILYFYKRKVNKKNIIMDQVNEYLKHSNGIQYHVITSLLNEFENDVSQMKGTVMDIGCGPGNSTKNLILPKVSKDAVIVGLDISEKMIECARILNADEKERLNFEQFDIEAEDFPVEYKERFDHGFSFFCLHWIADLRLAFENIYKLLKPGGTFLSQTILVFNGYNGYLKLSESEKFKEYMKDARRFVTSLYFDKDPRAALIEILQDIGFQVLHCSVREKITGYKSQLDRKELYTSINPFVPRMPEDVKNDFMDKLMEETLKEENVLFRKNDDSSNEDKIFDLYKLIMFYIKKPENEF
ncbi:uncharacterized protein LOC122500316 [Leptopilina heterotoma]|uniref:uncharacterized protein LOC122500316 n=1 Tax=Leptopilina heterotoma TaxID=63436 RepID=UPI001CA84AD5|nr:uncharacterized protein LOC122500316 [Leptopilina heterotoma]